MMPVDSDVVQRIVKEVTLGTRPPRPDTAEEARLRKQLKVEVRSTQERGDVVDIPREIP